MMTLLIVVAVLLALSSLGLGLFWVLVQLGVIVHEAGRPQHMDTGDYRLSQGREVTEERKR